MYIIILYITYADTQNDQNYNSTNNNNIYTYIHIYIISL